MKKLNFLVFAVALMAFTACQSDYDDLTTKDHADLVKGEYFIQENSYFNAPDGYQLHLESFDIASVIVEKVQGGIFVNSPLLLPFNDGKGIFFDDNELLNGIKKWTDAIFFNAQYVLEKTLNVDGEDVTFTIAFGLNNESIYSDKYMSDIMIKGKFKVDDVNVPFTFYGSRDKKPVLHKTAWLREGQDFYYEDIWYDVCPMATKIIFQTNVTSQPSNNAVLVSEEGSPYPAWAESEGTTIYVRTTGNEFMANESCYEMFEYLYYVETIDFGNAFNTINVTDMEEMFGYCYALRTLNLSCFNTEHATNMNQMFYGCYALQSVNLSSFDTSNVTSMYKMFYDCNSLKSLNLSNFNTSSVENMEEMFCYCKTLESLDLSSFNTSNVENMSDMFYGCIGLTKLNISSFDTSNVCDMDSMFELCLKLKTIDVSNFDVSQVTDMEDIFRDCQSLTSLNLNYWNTKNCGDFDSMFYNCYNLKELNLGKDVVIDSVNSTICYNMGRDVTTCTIKYYKDNTDIYDFLFESEWYCEDNSISDAPYKLEEPHFQFVPTDITYIK